MRGWLGWLRRLNRRDEVASPLPGPSSCGQRRENRTMLCRLQQELRGSGSMGNRRKLCRSSLLSYIRGHPLVTVPQIRWRFELDGEQVSALSGPGGTVFVGLPERAAQLLQELWREGKVYLESAADLNAPLVLGAYAARAFAGASAQGADEEVGAATGLERPTPSPVRTADR